MIASNFWGNIRYLRGGQTTHLPFLAQMVQIVPLNRFQIFLNEFQTFPDEWEILQLNLRSFQSWVSDRSEIQLEKSEIHLMSDIQLERSEIDIEGAVGSKS